MELTNDFTVDVPIEDAWVILTDLERIAPCMPGARLDEAEGDEYRGAVKVKVGPVTAEYRGKATFVERDATEHRAVLRAEGREARGQGNASATITARLEPVGDATKVSVTTDLTITGRVAQFGRGVLADVSTKLLGQFVESLEATVLSGTGGSAGAPAGPGAAANAEPGNAEPGNAEAETETAEPGNAGGEAGRAAPGTGTPVSTPGTGSTPASPAGADRAQAPAEGSPAEASVDLLRVAGPAVAKRAAPVLGAAAAVWAVWRLRRRRRQ